MCVLRERIDGLIFSHLSHYHHHHDDQSSSNSLEPPKITVGGRSKSPLHAHSHHHAHTHIHHHHPVLAVPQHQHHLGAAGTTAAAAAAAAASHSSLSKIATILIDSSKVLASLESKPRNYLGSMVYLPTPTPKEGYSVTQPLIPRFEGRENSIFQIRIPKRFLSDAHRRDVTKRRCLWGTEVYADDSDTLAVLMHTGRIPGYLPEDVDPALVKESGRRTAIQGSVSAPTGAAASTGSSGKWKVNGTAAAPAKKTGDEKRAAAAAAAAAATAAAAAAAAATTTTPPTIPAGKDLLVNLLILPTLERYTGSVRHALKSRSWNTVHDGMSYSIWDMEWVDAGEAESRGGGSKKRRLDEREWVRRWGELPPSRGGTGLGLGLGMGTGKQSGGGGWTKGLWRGMAEGADGKGSGAVAGVGA